MVVDAYAGEKHLVNLPEADHNTLPEDTMALQVEQGIDWLWTRALVAAETTAATRR